MRAQNRTSHPPTLSIWYSFQGRDQYPGIFSRLKSSSRKAFIDNDVSPRLGFGFTGEATAGKRHRVRLDGVGKSMQKPPKSFWQIWNMSFGFLGIQFGWGLQMANMSAIYEYLGARADQIPILWLAAPLTGLLVQPIIGHASDHTWTRLGRRRPYFLAGAILSSCALILMPRCSALWMAAGLLWILDTSINISMEPFRAFVADLLPEEQRPKVPGTPFR
jgi:hypothetical protein